MKPMKKNICFAIIVVYLFFSLATTLNAAPSPADISFYKGKLITYIVATKPGGGYDLYARLIARYLQKYIPGSTVIVQNVPGAGHIVGANQIYLALPDGLTIGTFDMGLIYSQIVGQEGIRFDLAKFSWIGKANAEVRVLIVGAKTPYTSIKDVLDSKEPFKMPASGVGASDYNEEVILARALPAKFQPIPGYGGNEGELAILRGECAGVIGSYSGLQNFIKDKDGRVLLQWGSTKKIPGLENVPHISQLNVLPTGRSLISIVNTIDMISRITAGPPGMPAGRFEVLRDAYRKALNDPGLIHDAEKLGADLDPAYGVDVQKMVLAALHQPEENLKMLKQIIKIE